jgi:hypothetical protein
MWNFSFKRMDSKYLLTGVKSSGDGIGSLISVIMRSGIHFVLENRACSFSGLIASYCPGGGGVPGGG